MSSPSAIATFAQLCFDLVTGHHQPREIVREAAPTPAPVEPVAEPCDALEEEDEAEADADTAAMRSGRDPELEQQCRNELTRLGILAALDKVKVLWNSRLRSTAGYAAFPDWRIELNPRLIPFEGQVDRTLKHELAHLVAYHRAQAYRRRIEPHGNEWRQACIDLGIPGEPAHHRLPFPRSQMQRNHAYQCPACKTVVKRVRPFKRATACLACCRAYAGGAYDQRFKFNKVHLDTQS